MSVSAVRSSDAPVVASVGRPVAGTTSVAMTTVSRDELARLDARIRSVETAQAQAVPVQLQRTAAPAIDEGALFERVRTLVDERIAQSERRTLRTNLTFARALDAQRATTARVGEMDEEILELKQAFRTVAPSMVQLTSFQGR
jgi:hypothetical protein